MCVRAPRKQQLGTHAICRVKTGSNTTTYLPAAMGQAGLRTAAVLPERRPSVD